MDLQLTYSASKEIRRDRRSGEGSIESNNYMGATS